MEQLAIWHREEEGDWNVRLIEIFGENLAKKLK